MVNAFVTFFVGFFGLLLGAFYYFDREVRSAALKPETKPGHVSESCWRTYKATMTW